MSVTPGWTSEQIRDVVFAYEQQPHGTKSAFLAERGISKDRLRRWRGALFDGDLDAGVIPREGSSMSSAPRRRNEAKLHTRQERENERLRERVRELEATNEALGKAIGLLHQLNAHEPDALVPPTNEPPSSAPPKTSS